MSTEHTSQEHDKDRKPGQAGDERREELAAFERLRNDVRRILGEVKDSVNADTIRRAVDEASAELKKLGKYTGETVNKVADAVKKDLAGGIEKMGPKWESFTEKSTDVFSVWRDRGSRFLADASTAAGEWLTQLGGRLKDQTYHTGEMTAGGSFKCTACGELTLLPRPGHIPPCHHCQKTEFRRV
jgi:hypothetical protein